MEIGKGIHLIPEWLQNHETKQIIDQQKETKMKREKK